MSGLQMFMSSDHYQHSLSSRLSLSELVDRLDVMRQQESTHYRCKDYIGDEESRRSTPVYSQSRQSKQRLQLIDRESRVQMCEWCYQVVDFCKFRREVVSIGMSYLDRFLSTSCPRARKALYDRKEYQLAAMTTLYIAIKIFEPMTMDAGLVSAISHGCYTEDDIVEMEQVILTALSWRLNGPTTQDFLNYFIALLPPTSNDDDGATVATLLDFSRFQLEIAVCDYDFALQRTSVIALAAILNSTEGIEESVFSAQTRYEFLQLILNEVGMDPFSAEVNAARIRLHKLFSKNSGYDLPQIANLMPVMTSEKDTDASMLAAPASPVSVARSLDPDQFYYARGA